MKLDNEPRPFSSLNELAGRDLAPRSSKVKPVETSGLLDLRRLLDKQDSAIPQPITVGFGTPPGLLLPLPAPPDPEAQVLEVARRNRLLWVLCGVASLLAVAAAALVVLLATGAHQGLALTGGASPPGQAPAVEAVPGLLPGVETAPSTASTDETATPEVTVAADPEVTAAAAPEVTAAVAPEVAAAADPEVTAAADPEVTAAAGDEPRVKEAARTPAARSERRAARSERRAARSERRAARSERRAARPAATASAPAEPRAAASCLDEIGCELAPSPPACCARYQRGRTSKSAGSQRLLDEASGRRAPRAAALPERLDRGAISAGMSSIHGRVASCHSDSMARGQVTVSIKVAGSGKVESVDVRSSPDPELGRCVASRVRRATFAKTQKGATFSYPFVFR